jgi:hypothetical protein
LELDDPALALEIARSMGALKPCPLVCRPGTNAWPVPTPEGLVAALEAARREQAAADLQCP